MANTPQSPATRARWLILLIFLLPVLAGGGLLLDAHRKASITLERHGREVAAERQSLQARSARRPVVLGDPEPGDGLEFYFRAGEFLAGMTEAEAQEIPEFRDEPGPAANVEHLDALYTKYAPVIEALRRAFRREEFKSGYVPDIVGWREFHLRQHTTDRETRFLIRGALLRHEQGRDREAMEYLVMVLGMAHDWARRGALDAHSDMLACEALAVKTAKTILSRHSLDAAGLRELALRLDLLESSRPPVSEAFEVEDLLAREFLLDCLQRSRARAIAGFIPEDLHLGRFGFSFRLAVSAGLRDAEIIRARMREIRKLPSNQRVTAALSLAEEVSRWKNPLSTMIVGPYTGALQEEAMSGMSRTLFRVAVAIATFDAEKGAFPVTLQDLVPKHLTAVPLCPPSGNPLEYAEGRVSAPDYGGEAWEVRRK